MELTEKTAAERACERLVVDFAYFSDRQEYQALVELFAADGVMQRPNGDRLVSRDAILKAYQARPAGRMTRHVCTNIRITVESQDRARGFTYAIVYSAAAAEATKSQVGEFEDEFVRTPAGWLFKERRARFVM